MRYKGFEMYVLSIILYKLFVFYSRRRLVTEVLEFFISKFV